MMTRAPLMLLTTVDVVYWPLHWFVMRKRVHAAAFVLGSGNTVGQSLQCICVPHSPVSSVGPVALNPEATQPTESCRGSTHRGPALFHRRWLLSSCVDAAVATGA